MLSWQRRCHTYRPSLRLQRAVSPKSQPVATKKQITLEVPDPHSVKQFSKSNTVTGVQVTLISSYFASFYSPCVSRAPPQTLLGGGGGKTE